MDARITFLMAMSCVIPACAGIYKYNRVDKKYHFFFYMMMLDVVMELIYYFTAKFTGWGWFNQLAVNIYMLLNFGLCLYFVFVNNYLSKRSMQLLAGMALLTGVINFIYYGTVYRAFYYLLIFVSVVMLFIWINILSRQILEFRVKLGNNFWFRISSFSILYHAFNLLIFSLYIFALSDTPNGKAIGIIQHFVNATCYLVFAISIFKIPEKERKGPFTGKFNIGKSG